MPEERPDVTARLVAVSSGDECARSDLIEAVYSELRRLARGYLQRERPDHSVGPEQELLPPALGVNRNFFPAENGIYYSVKPDLQRPYMYEIRFLRFATAASETLYSFESLGLSQGLSVSADGNTIMFSGISPSKNSDLMLIQNFR